MPRPVRAGQVARGPGARGSAVRPSHRGGRGVHDGRGLPQHGAVQPAVLRVLQGCVLLPLCHAAPAGGGQHHGVGGGAGGGEGLGEGGESGDCGERAWRGDGAGEHSCISGGPGKFQRCCG